MMTTTQAAVVAAISRGAFAIVAAVLVACVAATETLLVTANAIDAIGTTAATATPRAPLPQSKPQHREFRLDGVPREPGLLDYMMERDDRATIFVSVASFRDPECTGLVREIFGHALNPRRIVLGIIEQNEPGDPTCVPDEFRICTSAEFCPVDNIRVRRVVSRRGKGPTYGRYVSMLSYRGEAYYMMIDSHTGAVRNWDRRVLLCLRRAHSPRPVLSHYPHNWEKALPHRRESQSHLSVMCNGHYLSYGFIRLDGIMFPRKIEPYAAPFAAAGFLFADARLVHLVPFDPLLDYIFDGEEILYSTRMWTWGFDIFAPCESVVFHSYGRRNATKFWGTQLSIQNSTMHRAVYWARRRVQHMLRVVQANTTTPLVPPTITIGRVVWQLQRYGLGPVRSLGEYNRFAMIDPINQTNNRRFCDRLLYNSNKMRF